MSAMTYARKDHAASAPSLKIGPQNDAFEREADGKADEVMRSAGGAAQWSLSRMSIAPPLQRKCSCGGGEQECEECKAKGTVQRKASGTAEVSHAPAIVHNVLGSGGKALDRTTRSFFEPRFGHDFSKVRIHSDEQSAASARAVGALAYTVGNNVVFNAGNYSPNSTTGRKLLAHELAHVVQQSRGGTTPARAPGAPHEIDAARASDKAVTGKEAVQVSAATGIGLACNDDPEIEQALEGLKEHKGGTKSAQPQSEQQPASTSSAPAPAEAPGEPVAGPANEGPQAQSSASEGPEQATSKKPIKTVTSTRRTIKKHTISEPVVEHARGTGSRERLELEPSQAPRAQQASQMENVATQHTADLPRSSKKTVAATAAGKTISGYTPLPESPVKTTPKEVADYVKNKLNITLKPDAVRDAAGNEPGFPGKYHASHAEVLQMVAKPNEPVGVSSPMCASCRAIFKAQARAQGRAQVVSDPQATRVFNPDGTITEYWKTGAIVRFRPDGSVMAVPGPAKVSPRPTNQAAADSASEVPKTSTGATAPAAPQAAEGQNPSGSKTGRGSSGGAGSQTAVPETPHGAGTSEHQPAPSEELPGQVTAPAPHNSEGASPQPAGSPTPAERTPPAAAKPAPAEQVEFAPGQPSTATGSRVRGAAGAVAQVGISLLLAWLQSWLLEKLTDAAQQRFQNEVDKAIRDKKKEIAEYYLRNPKAKVYARVTGSVFRDVIYPDPDDMPAIGPGPFPSYPFVTLHLPLQLSITFEKATNDFKKDGPKFPFRDYSTTETFAYSVEVPPDEAEIQALRDAAKHPAAAPSPSGTAHSTPPGTRLELSPKGFPSLEEQLGKGPCPSCHSPQKNDDHSNLIHPELFDRSKDDELLKAWIAGQGH